MDILCPGCNLESKPFHETPSCMLIHLTTPPRPIMIIVLTSAQDGIGDGQVDFEALREDVAQSFIPWKESSTKLKKAAPWLAAAFSTAAAFVPFRFAGVSTAAAAFGGAALTEIAGDPAIKAMLVAFILSSLCFWCG